LIFEVFSHRREYLMVIWILFPGSLMVQERQMLRLNMDPPQICYHIRVHLVFVDGHKLKF